MKKLLFLLTILLTITINTVDMKNIYSKTVGDISFQQSGGMNKVLDSFLLDKIKTKINREFSNISLNSDIKMLYDLGYFDDIQAIIKDVYRNKVNIIFELTSVPKIKDILIIGKISNSFIVNKINKKINEEILKKEVGSHASTKVILDIISKVQKLYRDYGYQKIIINYSLENVNDNEVQVFLDIKETERLRISKVKFIDNNHINRIKLYNNIKSYSYYYPLLSNFINIGLYNEDLILMDENSIKRLYIRDGFLDVKIKTDIVKSKFSSNCVDVFFIIDEGKRYRINNIIVLEDGLVTEDETLLNMMKFKRGDYVEDDVLEKFKRFILLKFYAKGYYDCKCIINKKTVDTKESIVDIHIIIQKGKITYINDINIEGNIHIKDSMLRRELSLNPYDIMNRSKLSHSNSRLRRLNLFKSVDFNVKGYIEDYLESNVQYKDITFTMTERDRQFSFAPFLIYFDDNSFNNMAYTQFGHDNLNIFNPITWTGRAQSVNFVLSWPLNPYNIISGDLEIVNKKFACSFSEPWLFNVPLKFNVYYEYKGDNVGRKHETSWGADTTNTVVVLFGNVLSAMIYNSPVNLNVIDKIGDVNVSYTYQTTRFNRNFNCKTMAEKIIKLEQKIETLEDDDKEKEKLRQEIKKYKNHCEDIECIKEGDTGHKKTNYSKHGLNFRFVADNLSIQSLFLTGYRYNFGIDIYNSNASGNFIIPNLDLDIVFNINEYFDLHFGIKSSLIIGNNINNNDKIIFDWTDYTSNPRFVRGFNQGPLLHDISSSNVDTIQRYKSSLVSNIELEHRFGDDFELLVNARGFLFFDFGNLWEENFADSKGNFSLKTSIGYGMVVQIPATDFFVEFGIGVSINNENNFFGNIIFYATMKNYR